MIDYKAIFTALAEKLSLEIESRSFVTDFINRVLGLIGAESRLKSERIEWKNREAKLNAEINRLSGILKYTTGVITKDDPERLSMLKSHLLTMGFKL